MKTTLPFSLVPSNPATAPTPLHPVHVELIDLCVRVAQFLGLPRSVGEIYGLLFTSSEPLCLDQCIERLGISQGSASQGLKQLRQLKAIKPIYLSGDRRDFYTAETGLGTLAQGFLQHRILPGLEDLDQRLVFLEEKLRASHVTNAPFLRSRLQKVRNWTNQGNKLIQQAGSLLGIVTPVEADQSKRH